MGDELLGGRYLLGEVVGSGGTGSVRRARDTLLRREVAIKRLRAGEDPVARERLRQEARLAGGLQHPGIAQVFDVGEEVGPDGERTPYLVMEYVDGRSLWQLLREQRTLPATEVMRLLAQLAEALAVAHRAGVVHRDLKPGNVLVTDEGRTVLVDFGIARTQDADPLTMTGAIVGTADYISPEQSAGAAASPRSDLYSLGMVAYECLSGRKPFRRESQVATALAHLRDDVPPLGPQVPRGVRALVASMIAKSPADRPASAAEVARLAALLAADPETPVTVAPTVVPAPTPVPEGGHAARAPLPGRARRRVLALAGAAVVLAVAASVAVVLVVGGDASAPGAAAGSAGSGQETVAPVASHRVKVPVEELVGVSYEEAARRLVALGLVPLRRDVRPEGDAADASGRAGTVIAVRGPRRVETGDSVTLLVPDAPVGAD